jgi:hypothetical protein
MKLMSSVLILCIMASASADTVVLTEGGEVSGTVLKLVYRIGEDEKTAQQGGFHTVELGEKDDRFTLADGTVQTGRIVSVRIKSAGGEFTFERAKLKSVRVRVPKPDDLQAEFLAKRAKVRDDDGEALYDLADWCRDKGLKTEMIHLARKCLEAKPKAVTEVFAHRMLGHVLRDGKWIVPPRQASDLDPLDTRPVKPTPAPPAKLKGGSELVQYANQLIAETTAKIDEAKSAEWAEIEKKYRKKWDEAEKGADQNKKELAKLKRQRDNQEDDLRAMRRRWGLLPVPTTNTDRNHRRKMDSLRDRIDKAKRRITRLSAPTQKALKIQAALKSKIEAAQAKVRTAVAESKKKLAIATSQAQRLIPLGKLNKDQLKNLFDDVIK